MSKDLGRLKEIYETVGCREYLVWATEKKRFYCFRNGPDGFQELKLHDGVFRSETFPGLWIDTAALLADDLSRAIETLRSGLRTDDHDCFTEKLASRRS